MSNTAYHNPFAREGQMVAAVVHSLACTYEIRCRLDSPIPAYSIWQMFGPGDSERGQLLSAGHRFHEAMMLVSNMVEIDVAPEEGRSPVLLEVAP